MAALDINADPYAFSQRADALFTPPVSSEAVRETLEKGAGIIGYFEDTAESDMLTNMVQLLTRYTLHLESRIAELESQTARKGPRDC